MLGFIIEIDLKVTCIIKDSDITCHERENTAVFVKEIKDVKNPNKWAAITYFNLKDNHDYLG